MINYRNWLQQTTIYYSSSIEKKNREAFRSLKEKFQALGIQCFESIDASSDFTPSLLSILILDSQISLKLDVSNFLIKIMLQSRELSIFKDDMSLNNFDLLIYQEDIESEIFNKSFIKMISFKFLKFEDELYQKGVYHFKDTFKAVSEYHKLSNPLMSDELLSEIMSFLSFDELIKNFEKLTLNYLEIPFSLLTPAELYIKKSQFYLPIQVETEKLYFLARSSKCKEDSANKTSLVYTYLELFLERDTKVKQDHDDLNDYMYLISLIPYPFAFFDAKDELLFHHPQFVSLNISARRCISYQDKEQVTLNEQRYVVGKVKDKENTLVFFNKVHESINKKLERETENTNSELGIITSSIAHELNNPLAGILAALDVILLDFDDDDSFQVISQMKQTVMRCKKLVETFLGFSRYSPNMEIPRASSLEDSFQQAIDLIRFRLIENNISLLNEFSETKSFMEVYNKHVMTMIFYLVLGEFLTTYSHHSLVSNSKSHIINIRFDENTKGINISKPKECHLSSEFTSGKLFSYLLGSQSLKMKESEMELKFFRPT